MRVRRLAQRLDVRLGEAARQETHAPEPNVRLEAERVAVRRREEEQAAGAKHARAVGDEALHVLDVLDDVARSDDVEALVREGQGLGGAGDELDSFRRFLGEALLGEYEPAKRDVARDHACTPAGQCRRERRRTAADLEDTVVRADPGSARRLDRVHDRLGLRSGLQLLRREPGGELRAFADQPPVLVEQAGEIPSRRELCEGAREAGVLVAAELRIRVGEAEIVDARERMVVASFAAAATEPVLGRSQVVPACRASKRHGRTGCLLGRAAHALSLAKLGHASALRPAAQAQTRASPGPGWGHTGVRPGSDPRLAPT